jgi:membrane-bound lytic murein transglycosylase D
MTYCGITLRFTPAGRAAIQKHVDKLTENPLYFNILVEKADLYMPFVEHAMRLMHVPEDLKYICIQESALQADAVSSSLAVGFWQFKDFTATEVGLRLESSVDERKHIFHSSVGAARYFSKNYLRHPNWVYSIISYYAGGTGAIPFIKQENYGVSVMEVDETLHWYAQKAIAHKIAFEEALNRNPRKLWLEPVPTLGETDLWKLATRYNTTVQELRDYNKWITASPLPDNYHGSLYIPRKEQPYAFVEDPVAANVKPLLSPEQQNQSAYYALLASMRAKEPEPINLTMKAGGTTDLATNTPPPSETHPTTLYLQKYRELPPAWSNLRTLYIGKDPLMGQAFVLTTDNFDLEAIAGQFGLQVAALRRYNQLSAEVAVPAGRLIWLQNPAKLDYYIVQQEASLAAVAQRLRKQPARLAVLNHMDEATPLRPGQKLYLRTPRPAEEPLLIYTLQDDTIDLTKPGK